MTDIKDIMSIEESKIEKKTNIRFICSDGYISIPSIMLTKHCSYITNILTSDEIPDSIDIDVKYITCIILLDAITLCSCVCGNNRDTRYANINEYLTFFNHMLLDIKIARLILHRFINDSTRGRCTDRIIEAYMCFPDMFDEDYARIVHRLISDNIIQLASMVKNNILSKEKINELILYYNSVVKK